MTQLTSSKSDQNAIAKLFQAEGWPDTLSAWANLYFQVEVTTSERSRKEQQRDLRLFLDFLKREAGGEQRAQWTPRVSRAFVDQLRKEITPEGKRRWADRTIIYTLIETGMRRAEVVSINLAELNEKKRTLLITEKGGQRRQCLISKEGMRAIADYLREERGEDESFFPMSPALFLPANTVVNSTGRLSPVNINTLWKDVCRLAGVKGRTPHSARHAMGVYFIKKTGNPRAAQRQLGHKNPSTTMQYMQFTQEEMQEVLDER